MDSVLTAKDVFIFVPNKTVYDIHGILVPYTTCFPYMEDFSHRNSPKSLHDPKALRTFGCRALADGNIH